MAISQHSKATTLQPSSFAKPRGPLTVNGSSAQSKKLGIEPVAPSPATQEIATPTRTRQDDAPVGGRSPSAGSSAARPTSSGEKKGGTPLAARLKAAQEQDKGR